jgi:DNA-binding transcriptional regulator YiaG
LEKKLSKKELKAVREVLGITQQEFALMLGISKAHLSRTEQRKDSKGAYEVSNNLDHLVKNKLKSMEIDLEEILEIARLRGMLK